MPGLLKSLDSQGVLRERICQLLRVRRADPRQILALLHASPHREMYLAMGVATAASGFLASFLHGSRGVRDSLVFVLAFPVWILVHAVVFLLESSGSWWTDIRRHVGRIKKGDRGVPMDPTGRMVRHLALLLDETRAVAPRASHKVPTLEATQGANG